MEFTVLPGWAWTTFMRFRGPQALNDSRDSLHWGEIVEGPFVADNACGP